MTAAVQPIQEVCGIRDFHDATKLRQVFYMPGFDPREPETYWGLFRRESRLTASRRGMTIEVGDSVRAADGLSLDWMIGSLERGIRTETRYGLLRWDDIVRARFPRSNLARLTTTPSLWWRLWRSGYVGAFWREAWQFTSVILFVHLMYVVLTMMSLALAAMFVAATPLANGPEPLAFVATALVAYPILGLLTRMTKGRPFYVAHLVDDTAFTHDHAAGRVGEVQRRLDAWAERIRATERNASEIVVIGHSSSSFLALEALDRVLTLDPGFGRRGTPVTLVTLGSVIPWITLDPRAEAVRGALQRVADADAIAWLDLRAPWDWLSIHLRNPLAASGAEWTPEDRPLIRSIALEDLIEPKAVMHQRWNFFRMHFQLLMSSRDRRAFDYIALIAGSEPVHRAVEAMRSLSHAPTTSSSRDAARYAVDEGLRD